MFKTKLSILLVMLLNVPFSVVATTLPPSPKKITSLDTGAPSEATEEKCSLGGRLQELKELAFNVVRLPQDSHGYYKVVVRHKNGNPDDECLDLRLHQSTHSAKLALLQVDPGCFQPQPPEGMDLTNSGLGSCLLQFAIKLAKSEKMKSLSLTDASEIHCPGQTIEMNLARVYLMTHGTTWYGKFGFLPSHASDQRWYAAVQSAIHKKANELSLTSSLLPPLFKDWLLHNETIVKEASIMKLVDKYKNEECKNFSMEEENIFKYILLSVSQLKKMDLPIDWTLNFD